MGGSSKEEEKDDMDSLFEGMILINPSPLPDYDDKVVVHQQLTGTEQEHQQQQQPGPPPPPSSSYESDNTLVSQPLDENLFSDLTLIAPLQNQLSLLQVQPEPDPDFPPPTTTTTTTADDNDTTATANNNNNKVGEVVIPSSVVVSRQISTRKKKRAGGLRIGYGRDAPNVLDDQSDLPPLPPSAESELELESESRRYDDPQQQHHHQQQQQQDSSCSPSTTTTEVVESDFPDITRSCKEEEEEEEEVGSAAAHSRVDDDNLVSDAAEPTTTADQVNDGGGGGGAPIEVRFERIKAQISQKLTCVRELVASVSTARKDSTRKRRKAAETVNLASARYRQLEKQLEEACEAEDFERAERVSESLASVEKEKECLAIDLKHVEADCDAVDSNMQEVLQCQIAAEEECATLLKNFSMDAANDADLVLKSAEVSSEKELDRWLSLTEELELKKIELDIESHLINAAQLVLNDSIERSVEDDRRERELLCKRKETLTEELEILLALVKQKEAEIAKTDHSIKTVDKRIADVVSGYQEVHSIVDTKYDYLQSDLSQIELENEALTRKKKEIDDYLSQEKDRGTKLQELAQISADEANMYQGLVELRKSLVLFILKSREDKVGLGKTEEKLSEDVHMLKQEISAARASLQELSSTKSSFQQEIESLKQRLVFIEKRVPELEAEKKVAAAARNFKEAARIATESKTLSVEKDGLQIKIAEAVLKIGKLEEDICNTVNRLQETEGQISSKEKEVAMARFQRLLLVAGSAQAERSAALELGDLEEAGILLAEAEAAESEARKIQPIYNLKEEEFTNLPKQYISMELVSNLGGKQLAELAASAYISTV